ncbi:MAG: hypothetical protein LH461_09545 [Spirochaetaceae bacterium]|nr:hypothetical protein [Spirochaetaceae bacterium]
MNRTRTTIAAVVTIGAATVATTLLVPGVASSAPTTQAGVKAATARYHSVQQAERDGYSGKHEPCVSSPAGAMGFHYVNADLIADPKVDPLKPEILLYAPNKQGKPVLVGVEYLVLDPQGELTAAPTLFGETFQGPMPGHGGGMPHHYDLHKWVWSDNPSGEYAPFNPTLSCG